MSTVALIVLFLVSCIWMDGYYYTTIFSGLGTTSTNGVQMGKEITWVVCHNIMPS